MKPIEVDKLLLDIENPRLAEYQVTGSGTLQERLRSTLWQYSDAREVALSIAHGGFYKYEPLLVEKGPGSKYTVIEGNRRLTAVQILRSPDLRRILGATDLPQLSAAELEKISELPSVVTTRRESWRYLGFKHINGPATWGSYAKAKYVATLYNDHNISLPDVARQIGDGNATVERLYHGLMVVDQAEKWDVFRRSNTYKSTFHFSHIYTGLGYENIRKFLALNTSDRTKRNPVKPKKKKELGELLEWIYGDKSQKIEPRMRSQNPDLRILDQSIGSPRGLKALRSGLPLQDAKDASDGEEVLLDTAIRQAKYHLQRAHAYFPLGFDSDDDEMAQTIAEVAKLAKRLARLVSTEMNA